MSINQVLFGDCRDSMRKLIADGIKVQMCVTSPPYFGLRDYGTAKWEGGNPACDHAKGTAASKTSTLKNDGRPNPGSNNYERNVIVPYRDTCGKCGAIRVDQQIGLEQTPQEYVANMVEVFRLVRELLADDGTCWINIGDSYAANRGYQVPSTLMNGQSTNEAQAAGGRSQKATDYGLKPKDLIGIPWRVAFALQADGWYLRQDIIWHKPNPMPESVTDRCTKSHEYIFLLSKSERYYFDHGAIREGSADPVASAARYKSSFGGKKNKDLLNTDQVHTRPIGMREFDGSRNKRSVWEVATQPYSGAHFATFPPALIEPCILAGSRPCDIVFDPFLGSGTTAQVAQSLGRQWIGCELNRAYEPLQKKRTEQLGLVLA